MTRRRRRRRSRRALRCRSKPSRLEQVEEHSQICSSHSVQACPTAGLSRYSCASFARHQPAHELPIDGKQRVLRAARDVEVRGDRAARCCTASSASGRSAGLNAPTALNRSACCSAVIVAIRPPIERPRDRATVFRGESSGSASRRSRRARRPRSRGTCACASGPSAL